MQKSMTDVYLSVLKHKWHLSVARMQLLPEEEIRLYLMPTINGYYWRSIVIVSGSQCKYQ